MPRSNWSAARARRSHAWRRRACPCRPASTSPRSAYRRFVSENQLAESILPPRRRRRPTTPRRSTPPRHRSDRYSSEGTIPDDIAGLIRRWYADAGRRRSARRRAVVGHGGGPARDVVRGPAGHVSQRTRRRKCAGGREAVLGVALDGARPRLPGASGHPPGRCRDRRRRAAARAGRRGRHPLHRQPADRGARRGDDQRGLGAGRGDRRGAGHARHVHRRQANRRDRVAGDRRQERDDGALAGRHARRTGAG